TSGAPFHLAGVPLVNFLTAPFYLFDAMDTLDKIHRQSLWANIAARCENCFRSVRSWRAVPASAPQSPRRRLPPFESLEVPPHPCWITHKRERGGVASLHFVSLRRGSSD